MAPMNLAVHPSNRINAIKRSISGVKLLEFAFRLRGIVMARMIVMITQMNKIADPFRAPTTSSSVKTQNVSSKLTFATEKMIAVTIPMNRTNMLASRHHLDARLVNGNVQESRLVA